MFSIEDLTKVKKYFPIIYLSSETNAVAKLVILYDKIRNKFQDLQILIIVSDLHKTLFDYKFTMGITQYQEYKNNFPKELFLQDKIDGDTIFDFCVENEIDMFIKKSDPHNNSMFFLSNKPNESVCLLLERTFKLKPKYTNNLQDVLDSNSIVAGFESADLAACGFVGKKIILLGNEKRTNSFRKMFPDTVLVSYNLIS